MPRHATAPRLRAYRQKRDFTVTPEPAPGKGPPWRRKGAPPDLQFMVHKHDATRLHYDLRLEIDGALASWAIPKGPSYDPTARRLAVQTEDHPLEYGGFEGRIPDGEYGGGDSLIWDRGTYDTVPPGQAAQQREKGHLQIELNGDKLHGRWHLVRTRPRGAKAQWLCFKAKDGRENPRFDVVAERPESVVSGRRVTRGPERLKTLRAPHPSPEALLRKVWPPMRATLSTPERAPASDFRYEVKYDGYRGLAALSRGKLWFRTRNDLDLTARFPEVARALGSLHLAEVVLDGELVALDRHGVSHFQDLMTPGVEQRYVVFDLLWLDGEDLRARPLEERRDLLESVLSNVPPPIQLADRVEADSVEDALAEVRKRKLEGLVAKRRGSAYVGTRSSDWLKLKVTQSQELAILGYTPISNGGPQIGALLVGVHGPRGFLFAGKVGTGYSAKVRRDLKRTLDRDRIEKSAAIDAPRLRDARWVRPRLVAELGFTEWTGEGKLRHPVFLGLREDKRPEEAVREQPATTKKGKAPKVTLTSGDRVLFPESGITKGDVYAYYQAIAPVMVPSLIGRPLTLQQWPKGIGAPGFFRQDVKTAPPWMTRIHAKHEGRTVDHATVDSPEALLWLANQSALTLHMWSSHEPRLTTPDWVVFDLDPGDGPWEDLIKVALTLRGMLDALDLVSVPKTSGKRGIHILVPIAPGHTYEDTAAVARAIADVLADGLKEIATTERALKNRHGRLYVDAHQNGWGKTVVAPYSVRGIEGAPVSTPLRWSEVTRSLDPKAFTIATVPKRVDEVGDLFAEAHRGRARLPKLEDPETKGRDR